jgi:hypothetical protein
MFERPSFFAITASVPLAIAQDKTAKDRSQAAPSPSLTELEAEVIGLFVQVSRMMGLPRSYAEIYAVLFLSPDPLTMDQLIERQRISRGSASQGLGFPFQIHSILFLFLVLCAVLFNLSGKAGPPFQLLTCIARFLLSAFPISAFAKPPPSHPGATLMRPSSHLQAKR